MPLLILLLLCIFLAGESLSVSSTTNSIINNAVRGFDDEDTFSKDDASTKPFVVQLPDGYSVHQPPPLVNGTPIPIHLSLTLFNVFDIKELQGDLSLEVNMKIHWTDVRLANWTGIVEQGTKYTVLNPSIVTKIWHPDVFIDHMKKMSQPSLITKAASLRIYPDGSLRYSARMLIDMNCHMNFFWYPADTQECLFDIKSYAYSSKHLLLSWKDNIGPKMAYPVELHNFDVAVSTSPDYLQVTKSDSYSAIRFTLFLRRKLSYHIIQTFIPSTLFTIVSWLSFLVPPESTPGRMAICVTTLLTLTAMFAAVRQNTPSVSYIKALDLWMVTCVVFVFSVIIEYTTVLKLRSMKDPKSKKKKRSKAKDVEMKTLDVRNNVVVDVAKPLMMQPAGPPPPNPEPNKPSKYFLLACKFEKYTPRAMPILFLLFNFFYWPYLLLSSDYYKLRQDEDMYYSI